MANPPSSVVLQAPPRESTSKQQRGVLQVPPRSSSVYLYSVPFWLLFSSVIMILVSSICDQNSAMLTLEIGNMQKIHPIPNPPTKHRGTTSISDGVLMSNGQWILWKNRYLFAKASLSNTDSLWSAVIRPLISAQYTSFKLSLSPLLLSRSPPSSFNCQLASSASVTGIVLVVRRLLWSHCVPDGWLDINGHLNVT